MTAIIKRKINDLSLSQRLALIGLVVLFLALRWNNFAAPLGRDEGEYAYGAQLLIQCIAPYQHAFIQKPPAIFYTYALSNLLLPHVFWSSRLLAGVFVASATVLLGFIARLEFGNGLALPAMCLVTPMILLPGLDQAAASVEMFMLLPLLATVAVYGYSRQHGHKGRHWLAAGFLSATALLYKYTALPILAFLFAAWLFEMWRSGSKANSIFRALGCAAAGGMLASVLGLAFFLIHDGGKTFWECTVVFNRYYAASNLFGIGFFWSRVKDFWDNWWILFLMPFAVFLQPQRRVWFWLGIFLCSLVATNGGCYGQYYINIMPFWAMLNVAGICALASRISAWMPRLSQWTIALITAVVLLLIILPDVPWVFRTREQFVEEKMGESPFIEAQLLSGLVSRLSSPDDFIYVAGSEPEILFYAQRFSPTRFITSYALMDPNPLAPGYQQEAINDLSQRPPKLIVFVQAGNSWTRQATSPPEFINFLGGFLKQRYDLIGGYVKSEPQKGYWTAHLSPNEYQAASLLLYKLKPGGGAG